MYFTFMYGIQEDGDEEKGDPADKTRKRARSDGDSSVRGVVGNIHTEIVSIRCRVLLYMKVKAELVNHTMFTKVLHFD